MLRLAASLKYGHVTASLIVAKLSRVDRQNSLAAALKEYGALRRTVYAARYLSREDYRRKISRQLNKGESMHALRRDVFYAHEGAVRRHHLAAQTEQAWCLTIATNAISAWTTEYLGLAAEELRGRNQIGRVTWQSRPARQVGAEPDVDDHLRVDVRPARRRRGGHHHRQVLRPPGRRSPQLAHRSGPNLAADQVQLPHQRPDELRADGHAEAGQLGMHTPVAVGVVRVGEHLPDQQPQLGPAGRRRRARPAAPFIEPGGGHRHPLAHLHDRVQCLLRVDELVLTAHRYSWAKEGRRFSQELRLHPQLPAFSFQFTQPSPLGDAQRRLVVDVLDPVLVHPVPEGAFIDVYVTCYLGDRT